MSVAPPVETPRTRQPSGGSPGTRRPRRSLAGYLLTPVLLAAVVALLFGYVRSQELDTIESRRLEWGYVLNLVGEHLGLTVAATLLVLAIAIPLGILLTRGFARAITPPAIAIFNVGQAIPSVGLIVLFAIAWDIGFWPTVWALVAYTVLPVLRNTMVGLRQVDESVIESARGMGMTKLAVLTRIELPLAVPVIMAGVRTALTICVGTAALGALVGAGGLGELIVSGIGSDRDLILIVGAVLVAVLALLIDFLGALAEDLLRPRGV